MKNICQTVFCDTRSRFSEEEISALKEAIGKLPMDQQMSLHLRYTKQMTVKEVSQKMNWSITTTYNKINRAIFILKNQFNPSVYKKMYEILYPETGRPSLL